MMMFAFRDIQRALRDDRWKLIRYPQVDRTQLFVLFNDPAEVTNLADHPEYNARLATMTATHTAEMKRWEELRSQLQTQCRPIGRPNQPKLRSRKQRRRRNKEGTIV